MRMTVDVSDLKKLGQTLREYAAYSNRSNAEVVDKKAKTLAIGAKGVRGLYQEARYGEGPKTKAEIRALPERLGYRIKRWGGTVKQEIRRRLQNAGLFQSTGWISERYSTNAAGRVVTTSRGRVTLNLRGDRPSVTLINATPRAAEFAQRTGYINRAVRNITADMRKYITKKLASDAQKFSRPKPNFTTISELLRE